MRLNLKEKWRIFSCKEPNPRTIPAENPHTVPHGKNGGYGEWDRGGDEDGEWYPRPCPAPWTPLQMRVYLSY